MTVYSTTHGCSDNYWILITIVSQVANDRSRIVPVCADNHYKLLTLILRAVLNMQLHAVLLDVVDFTVLYTQYSGSS